MASRRDKQILAGGPDHRIGDEANYTRPGGERGPNMRNKGTLVRGTPKTKIRPTGDSTTG
jgi:hypothetical protein